MPELLKVRFNLPSSVDKEIKWAWELFARHFGIDSAEVAEGEDICIGTGGKADVAVSQTFIANYQNGVFDHRKYFERQPLLFAASGKPDYLGTAFYLVNCLQEWDAKKTDAFGRFLFEDSLQHRFQCTEQNLVAEYFEVLFDELQLDKKGFLKKKKPSKVFLTHDIDRVRKSLLSNSRHLLSTGQFHKLPNLLVDHLSGKPYWMNMPRIIALHQRHGFTSSFFWLVNRGKFNGIPNADYDIRSASLARQLELIQKSGFENGLHKSTAPDTYAQEMEKLGAETLASREHFLRLSFPETFEQVEAAGIKLECTLGFPQHIGFRNSYGFPFRPFNRKTRTSFHFAEVPLHIMDISLMNYMGCSPDEAFSRIAGFIERNSRNAIISILWHNHMLGEYKFREWAEVYIKTLDLLKAMGIPSVSLQELADEFLP